MITTVANQQIKAITKLKKSSKQRRKTKLFLVEGLRMYQEVPSSHLQQTYVTPEFAQQHPEVVEGREVIQVSEQVMKEISDTKTPQGIFATVSMCNWQTKDMLKDERPLLLVLENIQDPGNLGTMMRTGEGAGISGILMTKDTVDIYNPKVIRSTMGSIFRVPFLVMEEEEILSFLKEARVKTYGAHLDGSKYTDESFVESTAFFIGNEGNGLTERMTDALDHKIRIPMSGQLESLNAAMAAGLLVYEARRQREGEK